MEHSLKTYESLRAAAARWLLQNDRSLICCGGNELGEEFLSSYELPELEEVRCNTFVDENEQITLVLQSRLHLPANKSVSGAAVSFVILRHVRVLYDDYGNIYKEITLGYNF